MYLRVFESISCGKVKASLILQKINSYNRDNGVSKGLKEIGRIIKTKYIIDYYSDGDLRKKVQTHVNFLGRYILEDTAISTKDGLRNLEIKYQEL